MDLPEAEDQLELFKEQLKEDGHEDVQIIPLSTVTHHNVDRLLFAIADKLEEVKDIDFYKTKEDLGVNRVLLQTYTKSASLYDYT